MSTKSAKGNKAIKKLKAILPALEVKAPFTIPDIYICRRSYRSIPSIPGILTFFKVLTIQAATGAAFAGAVGLCLFAANPQDEWWDFEVPAERYPSRSLRRAVRWFRDNW